MNTRHTRTEELGEELSFLTPLNITVGQGLRHLEAGVRRQEPVEDWGARRQSGGSGKTARRQSGGSVRAARRQSGGSVEAV